MENVKFTDILIGKRLRATRSYVRTRVKLASDSLLGYAAIEKLQLT